MTHEISRRSFLKKSLGATGCLLEASGVLDSLQSVAHGVPEILNEQNKLDALNRGVDKDIVIQRISNLKEKTLNGLIEGAMKYAAGDKLVDYAEKK